MNTQTAPAASPCAKNARIVRGTIIVPSHIDDFVVIATPQAALLPQHGDAYDESGQKRIFTYDVAGQVIVFSRENHSDRSEDTLYLPAIDVYGKRDLFKQFRIAGPYDDVSMRHKAFNG